MTRHRWNSEMTTKLPWILKGSWIVSETHELDYTKWIHTKDPEKDREYYGGEMVCESVHSKDADLIVKAVNNHDELLATLKQLKEDARLFRLAWLNRKNGIGIYCGALEKSIGQAEELLEKLNETNQEKNKRNQE